MLEKKNGPILGPEVCSLDIYFYLFLLWSSLVSRILCKKNKNKKQKRDWLKGLYQTNRVWKYYFLNV